MNELMAASVVAATMLVGAVWQGALLAAMTWLCLRLLPGLSAAARSVVWTAVFAGVVLLHAVPFARTATTGAGASAVHLDARWSVALAAVWVALSAFRGVQLLLSAVALRRIARSATPVAMQPVDGRYTLCISTEVDRPSVAGFFAPRILLPPALLEVLTPGELDQVLLHETEHLRRGDDWTNLLQKLALVVFPLNPALLWVERRMCLERELACDDKVLAQTRMPKAYATCLTSLAERSLLRRGVSLALGALGQESELGRRVRRILAAPERTMSRRAMAGVTAVLLAGLAGGGVKLAQSPELVSFGPTIQMAQQAQAEGWPGRQAVSFRGSGAHATLLKAVMPSSQPRAELRPARMASRSAMKARKAVRVRRMVHGNAFRAVETVWTYQAAADAPRLVLTTADGDQVSYTLVPAVARGAAYAAVPVRNGWLIVQL